MIGMYAEHSGTFLRVFAVLTAVLFSIPILVAPLTWARTFQPLFFATLVTSCALMVMVHAVGALQKVQPWTETAEIAFWCGLAVLGLLFYPTA